MSARLESVDVVCPLYNAEKYLKKLHASFLMQEGVKIRQIRYVVTRGKDKTEEILEGIVEGFKVSTVERSEKGLKTEGPETVFRVIEPSEFSHSKTREEEILASKADVAVLVTQDVAIKDKEFLKKLVEPIFNGEADATYAKQITKYDNIEMYTRESNYPVKSFTVTKADIPEKGLKTFFFSDAAGAVNRAKFVELKGYDGKDLPISEDMYFAHKLIMSGGAIKYVAEAEVYHSHDFKLSELYKRYKLTGEFMKMNPEIAEHGVNSAGGGMAKYIFRRAWEERNFKVLAKFLPNMGARYLGMKAGRK